MPVSFTIWTYFQGQRGSQKGQNTFFSVEGLIWFQNLYDRCRCMCKTLNRVFFETWHYRWGCENVFFMQKKEESLVMWIPSCLPVLCETRGHDVYFYTLTHCPYQHHEQFLCHKNGSKYAVLCIPLSWYTKQQCGFKPKSETKLTADVLKEVQKRISCLFVVVFLFLFLLIIILNVVFVCLFAWERGFLKSCFLSSGWKRCSF